jgi:predicted TIM-barrel fold metal-dependent hydrolase
MLAIQAWPDLDYAERSCRAFNDWLADHCAQAPGRIYGVAVLPQQDIDAAAAELRRVARLPGIVGGFLRPNPTADWKPFSDNVYDPIWQAAADSNLALGFHPYLDAMLPGAAQGLRIGMLGMRTPLRQHMPDEVGGAIPGLGSGIDNMAFAQAIANPVDMMTALTFLTMGGVCERFPDVRFVFLEANGGWIVPWLERLDHHAHEFPWDMPGLTMTPSEYFRRQCWISFDPDEAALPLAATSPLCGADRIVWASDFPHPDAKYPGVTETLMEATSNLSDDARRRIAGENALRLYGLES